MSRPAIPESTGAVYSRPRDTPICTVTEVTELSFPPPGAAAVRCPDVPEPTGSVYRRPHIRTLYRH
jgi:hypothetical protein